MTITIGTDSLCDGADRSVDKNAGPSNFVMTGSLSPQVAEYIRADDVTVFNRKNRKSELAFDVKRQCSSVAAAESLAALYPWTVTRSGTLTITTTAGAVRILTAVLDVVRCSHDGATVFISYHAVGGKVEVVP